MLPRRFERTSQRSRHRVCGSAGVQDRGAWKWRCWQNFAGSRAEGTAASGASDGTRRKKDAYFGDLIVTVFGDADFDAEVLHYLESELRRIPGFPSDVAFEDRSGSLPRVLEEKAQVFENAACRGARHRAARFIQTEETFENPCEWPHRLWLIPLPEVDTLVGLKDKNGGNDLEAAELECQDGKESGSTSEPTIFGT